MPVAARPARGADAEAIGAVQSRAWRLAYADLLPQEALRELTPQALAEPWRRAIETPPSDRHVVLVAEQDDLVVGFAALAGIEITTFAVDPLHQRHGHGSRLLAAVVDTLRERGAPQVQTWVPERDRPRLDFLGSAGMAPDGARRVYERPDGGEVTELRVAAVLD